MRDESAYKAALWSWFLSQARKPGPWGNEHLREAEREHLEACGIDVEASDLPLISEIHEWCSTAEPHVRVPAITAPGWSCNCGKYGGTDRSGLQLFIPGEIPLGEIILGVVRAAEEGP